jgi:hypothetical protein
MTLQPRDRRALAFLSLSILFGVVYWFWPTDSSVRVVSSVTDPVSLAEKRLAKLRESAVAVPAKEAVFKKVSAELADREKAILQVDTIAQAQAQLLQIVRRLATTEAPGVEIRGSELGSARTLGDAYGEVSVAVNLECKIDALVNLLAAISNQPELISLTDVRVTSANSKEKTVGARLVLAAVVPKQLIPERAGDRTKGAKQR